MTQVGFEVPMAMQEMIRVKARGLEVYGVIDSAGREYVITIHSDIRADDRVYDEIIELLRDGTTKCLVEGQVWREGDAFFGIPTHSVRNPDEAAIVTRIVASRMIETTAIITGIDHS